MPKLSEIARELGLKVGGELNPVVKRVSSIGRATADALVFAGDEEGVRAALASKAGAVIVPVSFAGGSSKAVILAEHPKLEFARAARLLRVKQLHSGVHETAVLGEGTGIAADVFIGATAVIGAEVGIGAGSHIDAGCVIGDGVRIGSGCRLYPRVTVYPGTVIGDRVIVHAGAVLGADGFGYVRDAATGRYIQFPQQGGLVIEDDVEIGANSTVDKGALEETRIGRGTKIDNLVHIGHNCHIGQDVVIAAQAGLSGSITVEDGAVLGGQVGIGEHATVGGGVIVGGQGGILPGKKLKGKGVVFWGTPAKPVREYLKELATLTRLTKKST